ncbi:MAG: hypothetical protein M3P43_08445 [Actinomycetota bacterium]|nr:hypothetical protein [Actinomycetota bacterium]
MITAVMDAKEFAERLPGQVNKVMDALAEGELTLNVKGIDEQDIMRGVQKLANRLTAGLVVAALVIGAALIMRIPTRSRLFGYPSLAIALGTAEGVGVLGSRAPGGSCRKNRPMCSVVSPYLVRVRRTRLCGVLRG